MMNTLLNLALKFSGLNALWDKLDQMIKKCEVCATPRVVRPYELRAGIGRFCSRSCANVVKNREHTAASMVSKECKTCHKEFRKPFHLRKAQFCSVNCKDVHHSVVMRGESNPAWKGGTTPILLTIRKSRKSKEWRQAVFIRDNFVCQECGQRGGSLEAHHVKKFSVLMDELKENYSSPLLYTAAMAYAPLWNVANGITLCEKCHSNHGTR